MKKLERMDIVELVDTFDEKVEQANDLMDEAPESLEERAEGNYRYNNMFGFMISRDIDIVCDGIEVDKMHYTLFPSPVLLWEPIIILCSGDDIVSMLDYKEYRDNIENDKLISKVRAIEERAKTKMISNIKQMEDIIDFLHAGLSVSREEVE